MQDYDSEAILPSQTMMTSNGDIYFTFAKDGTYSFKVSFYDDSVEIDSITYSVTVSPTATDVSHDLANPDVEDGTSQNVGSPATQQSSDGAVETLN